MLQSRKKKHRINRPRWVWIILLLILLIPTGIFLLIRIFTFSPDPKGLILISRIENTGARSYWLVPPTGDLMPLEGATALDRPDLAPDGNQIVYTSWPGLAIYNLADHSIQQITDVERDSNPNWSPDGRSIVFINSRDFFSALYRYDVDSGERHQLTDYQNDLEPNWSPDGQRIVFTTSRDGFQELYTMKPDGTDLKRLTHNTGLNDLLAEYSPDGQHIAYMTNYSVGDNSGEIWVMNADGTNQRQITNNNDDDRQPTWSPDGRYIAFTGQSDQTTSNIFVYDFLTNQIQQVTNLPTIDANPVWSPDSEWIAFVSYTSNGQQSQLHIVRPDGMDLRPLVNEHRGYGLLLWMDSAE